MENTDPDTLLGKMAKPSMASDLFLSIVIHVLLIGLTSFGLFAAWQKWGVHAPNEIKRLEKAAAKEEAQKAAAAKTWPQAKSKVKAKPKPSPASAPGTSFKVGAIKPRSGPGAKKR